MFVKELKEMLIFYTIVATSVSYRIFLLGRGDFVMSGTLGACPI